MEIDLKKIILTFMLLATALFADLKNEFITKAFVASKTPIVDIRTAPEWRETGLIKGAIPITFFRRDGSYDARAFLRELNKKVDTSKPFALICHTGSRTAVVSAWLAKELGYKVINLKGGMEYATKIAHLPTTPYKK